MTLRARTTGSRGWVRHVALAGALAFGLLGPARPAAADASEDSEDREPTPLPLVSEGDIEFFVDVSGYREDPRWTEVELYLAVTNDQIRFLPLGQDADEEEDGPRVGEIVVETRVRDPSGGDAFQVDSRLEPRAESRLDGKDRTIVQSIREIARLEPGDYWVTVTVRDERALRPGLFNRMRNAKREGRAEGWIRVRDFPPDSLCLSDLTLTRGARQAPEGSGFGRYGVDFDANPSRYYGLVLPRVSSFLEVYAGEGFVPGDPFRVATRLADRSGGVVRESVRRLTPGTPAFVVTSSVEVEPKTVAGSYDLVVEVQNERTGETARASRGLEVLWGVYSWGRDPATVIEEMALIMNDAQHETLEQLSPGAREVYLAEFWHSLDPDPETPRNEVLDAFLARVSIADREFRSTLQRGILTDRGRVYVRYGPPDDVSYQYNSSSYGLDPSLERVADPAERATLGDRPAPSFLDADEFREGDVSDVAAQRGGANIKSKQLEVWTYDGRGHPLTDRIDFGENSHRGLKFIFADQMGNGDFMLIGSSGATLY